MITNWIRASELTNWADTLDSRSRFPQLVRRLLHATVEKIQLASFPAGEGVQREGFDGILETTSGNAFVPEGVSVWEFGVGVQVTTKANGDFKKRTDDPLGMKLSEISFMFITPRKWSAKSDWVREKNKLGIWKEVRAYDSDDFEQWLELAPSVDAWLAYVMGKRPPGILDIETHWENLASHTKLSPDVFLANRVDDVEFLRGWLNVQPSAIAIEARSPWDVLDFLAAYVASFDEINRDSQGSRIVIVQELESWNVLSASRNRLTLVAKPGLEIGPEMVAQAIRHGHQVLLSANRFSSNQSHARVLTKPHSHFIHKALVDAGFNEERAGRLARESRGSLSVLKRLVSTLPSTTHPQWSRPEEAKGLIPILLAGGWNDSSEADKAALTRLAGLPYSNVMEVASKWLASADSPILKAGSHWGLISREDSWIFLAPFISNQELASFEAVARDVLGEIDPQVGMDATERIIANYRGESLRVSNSLRNGLVETLALFGAKAECVRSIGSADLERSVARVLGHLFPKGADWKRWATLSHYLPLFAEAAPAKFLECVETDLKQSEPSLIQLFSHEGDPFFSSSPHTGLLWALENLAWDSKSIARVCLILARLDANDPGGKLGNRPGRCLSEIFLPWFPQTTATVEQRIIVLDKILAKEPRVGWNLMLKLLPNVMTHSDPIHRPNWRRLALGMVGREYELRVHVPGESRRGQIVVECR